MNKVGVWKNERLVHCKPLAVGSSFPLEVLGYRRTKMNFISFDSGTGLRRFLSLALIDCQSSNVLASLERDGRLTMRQFRQQSVRLNLEDGDLTFTGSDRV
jgi:hypothetical protein